MKLMDRKNGIAISETANPVGDSRLQAFGSGQQNLPLEDFEERILRIAFYKFPLSSPKTFHFVQFLNKIDLSIYQFTFQSVLAGSFPGSLLLRCPMRGSSGFRGLCL